MKNYKKEFGLTAFFFALSFFTFSLFGQGNSSNQTHTTDAYSAVKGFWNTESNLSNKKTTVVRFYLSDKTLIFEERIEGVKLSPKKPKVIEKLNAALDKVLRDYQWHQLPKDQYSVAFMFKK